MRHIQRNDISSPERGEEHTSRKREEREEVLEEATGMASRRISVANL